MRFTASLSLLVSLATTTPTGLVDRSAAALPSTCTETYRVEPDDFCSAGTLGAKFPANFTYTQLFKWNPQIGQGCWLNAYSTICVAASDYTFVPPSQSPPGSIVSQDELPVPIIGCAVQTCNKWYLDGAGTRTSQLLEQANITADEFTTWNTCLDKDNLEHAIWAEYWYCVGASA